MDRATGTSAASVMSAMTLGRSTGADQRARRSFSSCGRWIRRPTVCFGADFRVLENVAVAMRVPADQRSQAKAAIEEFLALPNDVMVRRVTRSSGAIVTTPMGHAARRRAETLAERADRALLMASERPAPGSGRALRTADLYSGCGGLSLGVEEACRAIGRRFVPVAAFDINDEARDVYETNFPGARTFDDDITTLFSGYWRNVLTNGE